MKKIMRSNSPLLFQLLFLFAATLPIKALAGGLSSFREPTPYGNSVYYDGSAGSPITFQFGEKSSANDAVSKQASETAFSDFYFYKGFVVAETDTSFTVINEKRPEVIFFQNKALFDNYLDANDLRPTVWTRWYNKNYDEANFKSLGFAAFFFFPISIFLIGLAVYFALSIRKTKKPLLKTLKKIYLIVFLVSISVVYLVQAFPQSI